METRVVADSVIMCFQRRQSCSDLREGMLEVATNRNDRSGVFPMTLGRLLKQCDRHSDYQVKPIEVVRGVVESAYDDQPKACQGILTRRVSCSGRFHRHSDWLLDYYWEDCSSEEEPTLLTSASSDRALGDESESEYSVDGDRKGSKKCIPSWGAVKRFFKW